MKTNGIIPVLSASEMRKLDDYTIQAEGIPGEVLMGNAAGAVYSEILRRFPSPTARIGIFCGSGNNGGDGLALGYLLWKERRRNFSVYLLKKPHAKALSPDAQHFCKLLIEDGPGVIELDDPSLLEGSSFGVKVDALFGTGLDSELESFWVRSIEVINSLSGYTFAVDCPSGLNSTTGEVMGAAVKANCTVTFGFPKTGFFRKSARLHTGELVTADIGLAELGQAGIAPSEFWASPAYFERHPIPRRKTHVHKGDFGRILAIAGSHGFTGAAKLCALSALRAGAGLVRLYVPAEVYVPTASSATEVMVASFDSKSFLDSPYGLAKLKPDMEWSDFIAIGSGLSTRLDLQEAAYQAISNSGKPMLADAEGCFAAKRWLLESRNQSQRLVLLTPHIAEFAKLSEISIEEVIEAPERNTLLLSSSLKCWVLLKSEMTFLASPTGFIIRMPFGSPALAKGGSGDVLAGAVAARCAITVKAYKCGKSPYESSYLSEGYYSHFPKTINENDYPWVEGIIRGYSLFSAASHAAARLAGSEESVIASEVAELLNSETQWDE